MKAKITMKNKLVIEIENDIATGLFIREIEGCKIKNNFFNYKQFYINPTEIEVIEILEAQSIKPIYVAPVNDRAQKTLEELQLEKQPLLNQYKNVVK